MSTFSLLLLTTLVVGSAWALTPQNPPFGQLSVSGSNLVDASGKPVQLRGMSLFWSQWMPQYWTKEVVTTLKCKWNANVVRAAMAVDQGGYLSNKQAELTKVRTIVEAAIEAGIYVIIDWHIHEAQSAKAEAITFFKQMATDYGKYPHVIYEIWNEPLQVDWNSVLKPYHTDLLAAIRPIDPKNIVLLGTPAWSGASGIQAANASPLTGQKNIMYVQHFYSGSHKDADRSALQTASIPIFVSEYGISEADGGSNGQIYTDEANKWFDLMDQKKVSYVNWAIDDKTESSAALLPGTQSSQLGDDSKLSPSGKFIKAMLIARNPKANCDGSSSPPSPPSGPPPPPPSVPSPPPSSPPSPPSSGAGGVSVNVKVTNQWQGGAQLDVSIVNNGDAKVCGATVKIAKDSATVVQNAWNLDGGPDLYTTPSYVSLSKGQTHTGGMVVQGKVPTFSVSSTKAC